MRRAYTAAALGSGSADQIAVTVGDGSSSEPLGALRDCYRWLGVISLSAVVADSIAAPTLVAGSTGLALVRDAGDMGRYDGDRVEGRGVGNRVEATFEGNPASVRVARDFVAATLAAWDLDDLSEVAALCTSEVATNAVRHAGSTFRPQDGDSDG